MDFTNLVELFTKIDAAIDQEEPYRALRLILTNFDDLPEPAPLRERTAQLLVDDDRLGAARRIYKVTGLHYANAGHPTRAIAVSKKLDGIDGDTSFLNDHVASIYSVANDSLDRTERHGSIEAPDRSFELEVDGGNDADEELYDRAATVAAESDPIQRDPVAPLPPLAFLSQMPKEALGRVLDAIDHRIHSEFGAVVDDEHPPEGLVWAVTPDMTIGDDDPTYRLNPGTLLGLQSVDEDEPTVEQPVFAREGSETLELKADAIEELADELDRFASRLVHLKHHAYTEALLEGHPLFEAVDNDGREDLLQRFSGLRIDAETVLVEQDERSPGIFLILDGTVDIVREEDDLEIAVRTLERGDIFGEMGLVSDRSTQARAVAAEEGRLLHLPSDDFQAAASDHPGLAKYTVNLAQSRMDELEEMIPEGDDRPET